MHKRIAASQPECSCSGNLRLFLLKGFEDQQAFPPGFNSFVGGASCCRSLQAYPPDFGDSLPHQHVDYTVCRLSKLHDDLHGFLMSSYKAVPVYFVKSFRNAC